MPSPTLKPCPWCGSNPNIDTVFTRWVVCCDNKRCSVNPMTNEHKSRKSAVAAWNRRAREERHA